MDGHDYRDNDIHYSPYTEVSYTLLSLNHNINQLTNVGPDPSSLMSTPTNIDEDQRKMMGKSRLVWRSCLDRVMGAETATRDMVAEFVGVGMVIICRDITKKIKGKTINIMVNGKIWSS